MDIDMKACFTDKPQHKLRLALALSLATTTPVYAQEFSQTVVFGDSLSDVGNFKQLNPNISNFAGGVWNGIKGYLFGTNNPDIGVGQTFSTNPDLTWAGHLPSSYSSNQQPVAVYAVGGAKVVTDNPQSKLFGLVTPDIPSVKTQLDGYLKSTNNTADPKALYAIWIGSNDLMGIKDISSGTEATKIVKDAAQHQVQQINRLHDAGAQYILVPSLPDVGITPEFNSDQDGQRMTQGAKIYNETLYQGLNSSSANIIPANTFALLNETVADYQGFGFKHANGKNDRACKTAIGTEEKNFGCGQSEWQTPTANEDYIFADGIHPSGKTHRILAQYYRSIIESPAQVVEASERFVETGILTQQKLDRTLGSLDKNRHAIWADVDISNASHNEQKMDKPNTLIGLNFAGENHHTGLYVNSQRQQHNISKQLTADTKEVGVGLYHQHDIGGVRIGIDAGVDRLNINTQRQIDWEGAERHHTGQADGKRYHAGVAVSYGVQAGKATIRPSVGLNMQHINLDEMTEDQSHLSTSLQYSIPEQESMHAKVGIEMDLNLGKHAQLSAGIHHLKDLKDEHEQHTVESKLSSLPQYQRSYQLSVESSPKSDYTNAHLGVKFNFEQANIGLGLTSIRSDKNADMGGYVGLQAKF